MEGIETVTISTPGGPSVTLTAEQFRRAPEQFAEVARAEKIVRESGVASISRVQREMGLGYNAAARLIEALELLGVVTAPDAAGKRSIVQRGSA
ncbi:DNA translocase FtsK [Luteimonas sp. MJ174]|uniref:DNA translocase FtsK n=1 Tax=Luteimonas sp. MJ174 TaxID=3129237 RepID=UPI0031B9F0A3